MNMFLTKKQQNMDALPGEKARVNAARWLLWGYIGLTVAGILLHILYRRSSNQPINWYYQILTLGIGLAACIALCRLPQSLSKAMLTFAVLGTICITALLVYQVKEEGDYLTILFMFHIAVFSLGLILGFKIAVLYATAFAIAWITISLIYAVAPGELVLAIVLAYAVALPSKVVEQLITESTAELSRINDMLRVEITERRRVEAELQKHKDHLEDEVEARTAELRAEIAERQRTEEKLQQRTLELETRNEELDAFAHTVAHDLKNPLTALVGYSNLLESRYGQLAEDRIHYALNVIAQNGRKMTNIIDELLLLATVRKASDVTMTELDMATIVNEAQKRLADLIKTHNVHIDSPATWPAAWGYGPWVEEVWTNYISNAIKYGGRPPEIELGATYIQDDAQICFWVRDNGHGLTAEEQARLFTPFTRLAQVQVKGHGLGLSIVRRIVEKLGGEVRVESEIGRGSAFAFTLPPSNTASHTHASDS